MLTVNGIGFERHVDAACRFGRVVGQRTVSKTTPATFIAEDRMVCSSPEWMEEQCTTPGCDMALTVSNDGVGFSGGVLGFAPGLNGGGSVTFKVLNEPPMLSGMSGFLSSYAPTTPVDQVSSHTLCAPTL